MIIIFIIVINIRNNLFFWINQNKNEKLNKKITVICHFIELAPQIITKLKDQKVATGERVLFEIELTKGDALVKWTKDNKELQLNNNVRLTIDGKKQKLEIVKASKTDSGVYGCQVHKQSSTAKLTVEGSYYHIKITF